MKPIFMAEKNKYWIGKILCLILLMLFILLSSCQSLKLMGKKHLLKIDYQILKQQKWKFISMSYDDGYHSFPKGDTTYTISFKIYKIKKDLTMIKSILKNNMPFSYDNPYSCNFQPLIFKFNQFNIYKKTTFTSVGLKTGAYINLTNAIYGKNVINILRGGFFKIQNDTLILQNDDGWIKLVPKK